MIKKSKPNPVDFGGTINVVAGPPLSPEPDSGREALDAQQQAVRDAQSGAWDVAALMAMVGELPGAGVIRARFDRYIAEARQRLTNQEPIAEGNINFVTHHNVSPDGAVDSHPRASAESVYLRDKELEAVTTRDTAVKVLDGEKLGSGGTKFTGRVPGRPSLSPSAKSLELRLALRPERAVRWFVDIGVSVLFFVVEWIVIRETLKNYGIGDQYVKGLLYAVSGLLVAVAAPNLLGKTIATMRRRTPTRGDWLVLGVGGLSWAAVVGLLAGLRVGTMKSIAVQNALVENVNLRAADVQFNGLFHFGVWCVLIGGAGLTIMLVKVVFHNPYQTDVVKSDSALLLIGRERLAADRVTARISDDITFQVNSREWNRKQYEQYIEHVLPQTCEGVVAIYCREFILALKDPDATSALLANDQDPGR